MWIITIGDPSNGFKYYGPFNTYTDAEKWRGRTTEQHWISRLLKD